MQCTCRSILETHIVICIKNIVSKDVRISAINTYKINRPTLQKKFLIEVLSILFEQIGKHKTW